MKTGYTLPVFACAGAIAALRTLKSDPPQNITSIELNLINPYETATIPIEQIISIEQGQIIAITHSDPGDNLDITRDTPIWSLVTWAPPHQTHQITIEGGHGIGRIINQNNQAAIYSYAQQLIITNLTPYLLPTDKIKIKIILPEGKQLATRTSNAAFGVVEGLSLLGTSGISQPLSSLEQLELFRAELKSKFAHQPLLFCIGENGIDLVKSLGIPPHHIIKTANWIGPLLIEAATLGVAKIILFGYHGKLIKLAGSIFHTHHHIADARIEIAIACAVKIGIPYPLLTQMGTCQTLEELLQILIHSTIEPSSNWVDLLYQEIAQRIDQNSIEYITKLSPSPTKIKIGSILFNRSRQILVKSAIANQIWSELINY